MRLIDADALLDEVIDRYCKDCDKRKGVKNGKWKFIYEIGDAPCRACSVDDMKGDIDDFKTAVEVVRCKDCMHFSEDYCELFEMYGLEENDYCSRWKEDSDISFPMMC